MIERDFTLSIGEITKSVFPPLQFFQIEKDDKIVYFNALAKLFEDNTALITAQHINIIIKQQNCTNIYMSIIGEQITSVHDRIDKLLSKVNSNTKGKEKVANTSVQPPPEIEDFKLKNLSDLESLLERKFKGLNMKPLSVDDFSGGEGDYKEKIYDTINKILEKYARKSIKRMYYYSRPTPQDVLLEEHEHIRKSMNGT
ncbi:hypothetical protein H5410_018980 [Solanum commersonii]|uniref:Uncharacterized protein n=1 Tax=Solanum commersonii TaxID=4109 RepID=A0A9J6A4M9_SOLCO|nr:hypothetical protein H5410_018980 [Solanum commersonii]